MAMHVDEPIPEPQKRAGEWAAAVLTMVLIAVVLAAVGLVVLWALSQVASWILSGVEGDIDG